MRYLLLILAAVVPSAAWAHTAVPGIKGFYTGLIHPLTSPAQALLVLAVGVMMGGFAPSQYRVGGVLVLLGALAGLLLGAPATDFDTYLLGLAIGAAVMSALLPGKGALLAVGCLLAASVLLGRVAVPDPGPQRERIITMIGSYVGLNLLPLYGAGLVWVIRERVRGEWVSVAFRILAAWIAAIAAILLALEQAGG